MTSPVDGPPAREFTDARHQTQPEDTPSAFVHSQLTPDASALLDAFVTARATAELAFHEYMTAPYDVAADALRQADRDADKACSVAARAVCYQLAAELCRITWRPLARAGDALPQVTA